MVVYSKLLEKFNDSLGYVIYVFELLDNEDKLREKLNTLCVLNLLIGVLLL